MEIIQRINRDRIFLYYLFFSTGFFLYILFSDDQLQSPLIFLSILVFAFPVGLMVMLPFKDNLNQPFIGTIPFCLVLGFILNYLWSFGLSSFTLNPIFLNVLFLISMGGLFLLHIKNKLKIDQLMNKFETESEKFNLQHKKNWIFFLIVAFIPSIFFLVLLSYHYDPIDHSDMAHYHTRLVDSILSKGILDPLWDNNRSRIGYPIGWHVTSASYVNLFNIEPLRMQQVVLSVVTFLTYVTLLSISYLLTRSMLFSSISLVAFFFTAMDINHIPFDYQLYYFGTFLAGLGPFQLSLLCLISLLALILLIKNKSSISFIVLIILLFLGVGFSHPPLIIYFGLWVSIYLIYIRKNKFSHILKSLFSPFNLKSFNISYLVLPTLVVGTFLGSIYTIQYNVINDSLNQANRFPEFSLLKFSYANMYSIDIYKYIVGLFVIISLLNFFYFKEARFFTLILFSTFFIAISITNFGMFEGFFVPLRINSLLIPLTWILLAQTLRSIDQFLISKLDLDCKINLKRHNNVEVISTKLQPMLIIFIIATFVIFTPYLINVIDLTGTLYYEFPAYDSLNSGG